MQQNERQASRRGRPSSASVVDHDTTRERSSRSLNRAGCICPTASPPNISPSVAPFPQSRIEKQKSAAPARQRRAHRDSSHWSTPSLYYVHARHVCAHRIHSIPDAKPVSRFVRYERDYRSHTVTVAHTRRTISFCIIINTMRLVGTNSPTDCKETLLESPPIHT